MWVRWISTLSTAHCNIRSVDGVSHCHKSGRVVKLSWVKNLLSSFNIKSARGFRTESSNSRSHIVISPTWQTKRFQKGFFFFFSWNLNLSGAHSGEKEPGNQRRWHPNSHKQNETTQTRTWIIWGILKTKPFSSRGFICHCTEIHTKVLRNSFVHVQTVEIPNNCWYTLHLLIHFAPVDTSYTCRYILHMLIHCAPVDTTYICRYILHMLIHFAPVDTPYICWYILRLLMHLTSTDTFYIY